METVQVQEVHVDSQMTAVKLDEETGLPADKAVDITAETAEETIVGEPVVATSNAPFDEPKNEYEIFGSGLMNFCSTFGLVGNETASLAEAKDQELKDQELTTDKIVQDLVDSEAQMNQVNDESDFKNTDEETANTSSVIDMKNLSLIAPAAPSDEDSQGKSERTQDTILSRVVRNVRKRNTICLYLLAIFVFLIMCGLFVAGGLFFRKNGW